MRLMRYTVQMLIAFRTGPRTRDRALDVRGDAAVRRIPGPARVPRRDRHAQGRRGVRTPRGTLARVSFVPSMHV